MFLTKRSYLLMGGAVVLAAALVTGARVYADRPDLLTVPEQTPIHITLDQTVASDQVRSGDHFQATVTEPVDVNGRTVIPQGAHVEGLVVDARKSGHLMGRAHLRWSSTLCTCRQDYDLRTTAALRTGGNHKKRNLGWIAGGAGGGALIGVAAAGGEGLSSAVPWVPALELPSPTSPVKGISTSGPKLLLPSGSSNQ